MTSTKTMLRDTAKANLREYVKDMNREQLLEWILCLIYDMEQNGLGTHCSVLPPRNNPTLGSMQ